MSGWSERGIPHKGWALADVFDTEADDENQLWHTCEMCDNEKVRYIHILEHPEHPEIQVGCICASRLTEDYEGPKAAERAVRNWSKRCEKWVSRKWKETRKGWRIKKGEHEILVYQEREHWRVRLATDEHTIWGPRRHASLNAAKLAVFDYVDPRPRPESA